MVQPGNTSVRVPLTLCKRGHPYAPFNLVASELPTQSCLACCRARAACAYAKKMRRPLPDVQMLADQIYEELALDENAELTLEDLFRRRRLTSRVDWQRFDDGEWWELVRGEDFESRPRVAVTGARGWASRRGGRRVQTHVFEDRIWIRFETMAERDARHDSSSS